MKIIIALWLERWLAQNLEDHLLALLAGMLGILLYMALFTPRLIMPIYDSKQNTLELGFVGYLIVGGTTALLVDWAFPIEILAGIFAAPVISLIIKKLPALIVKSIISSLQLHEGGEQ